MKNKLEFTNSTQVDDNQVYGKIEVELNTGLNQTKAQKSTTEPSSKKTILISSMNQTNQLQKNEVPKPTVSNPPNITLKKIIKPKTDLEIKIYEMRDEHPSKKKDIFCAIFESDEDTNDSSKADNDGEDPKLSNEILSNLVKPSTSATAVYSSLPNEAFMTKSAKELNILRNTSPPRGIFQSLMKAKPKVDNEVKVLANDSHTNDVELIDNSYGPSLPPSLSKSSTATAPPGLKSKRTSDNSSRRSEDQWVEKSSGHKKKSKKEKKHKHKSKKSKKKDSKR